METPPPPIAPGKARLAIRPAPQLVLSMRNPLSRNLIQQHQLSSLRPDGGARGRADEEHVGVLYPPGGAAQTVHLDDRDAHVF